MTALLGRKALHVRAREPEDEENDLPLLPEIKSSSLIRQLNQPDCALVPGFFLKRLTAFRQKYGLPDLIASAVDLSEYQTVLEHRPEDQVISVGTGMTLAALDAHLASFNQWCPVSIGTSDTTLSDLILSGEGGPLEHFAGGPRALALGLTAILGNGEMVRVGGKVLKNVTGYDVTKFLVGSQGVFGVPIAVNLRLFGRPEYSETLAFTAKGAQILIDFAQQVIFSAMPLACLELVDLKLTEGGIDKVLVAEGKFALLLRSVGSRELVLQISENLKRLAGSFRIAQAPVFSSRNEERLWTHLEDVSGDPKYLYLDIAASRKVIQVLLSRLPLEKYRVEYRIAVGRLRIFTGDAADMEPLVEIAESSAQELAEPLTVSYPHHSGKLFQISIGAEQIVQQSLFNKMKDVCDPRRILNQYVQFA